MSASPAPVSVRLLRAWAWIAALGSGALLVFNAALLLRPGAPAAPPPPAEERLFLPPAASLPPATPTPSPAPLPPTAVPRAAALPAADLPRPRPSPTPTATLLPAEARVDGLPRRGQVYPLSCEAHIAVTLAAWYGVPLSERAFQAALPRSDNPERGFVGDVHGGWGQIPPNDYGVHAPPVAALLRAYGLPARARRGMTWQELRAEIAAGRPVGVWVAGHVGNGIPVLYRAADGSLVTVTRFEHTVIVVGYTPSEVLILDGAGLYTRRAGDFLRSWSVLGNMALTLDAPPR